MAMTTGRMTAGQKTCLCAAVFIVGALSSATAEPLPHSAEWLATHAAIYRLENRIAYLEADPAIDDGYKTPIITGARKDIRELRATLPPAHWRWASPCCYSRKPIHLR
jgi:hypothetical protein